MCYRRKVEDPYNFSFTSRQSIEIKWATKKLPHVNQRMLIRQLRELEEDQIIERHTYSVVPPKVEYKLTSIGYKLDKVVYAICEWGDLFKDEIIH